METYGEGKPREVEGTEGRRAQGVEGQEGRRAQGVDENEGRKVGGTNEQFIPERGYFMVERRVHASSIGRVGSYRSLRQR